MRSKVLPGVIPSILTLGLVLASVRSEAQVRSTHVLLDRDALARARQQLGARSLGPRPPGMDMVLVEAPFSFTAVAALTNSGTDGELTVRVSLDGLEWSAPKVVPDDEPISPLDERGRAQRFAFDRVSSLYFPDTRKGGPPRFLAFEFKGAVNPPTRVALHFIDAGPSPDRPARSLAEADEPKAHALKPALVTREAWGARPRKYPYTLTLARHMAFHHTAGVGDGLASTTGECAAQVRSIQAFHQDTRGWNDVGYSYLICATGDVFQAREDDDDSTDVWGAHDGFNRGSMSVSLMGYFHPPYNQVPSPEMMASLVRTLSWMADIRDVDPLDASLYEAFGSVRTHVYGHREVRATDCPGETLFALKDQVRAEVADLVARFREGLMEATRRNR